MLASSKIVWKHNANTRVFAPTTHEITFIQSTHVYKKKSERELHSFCTQVYSTSGVTVIRTEKKILFNTERFLMRSLSYWRYFSCCKKNLYSSFLLLYSRVLTFYNYFYTGWSSKIERNYLVAIRVTRSLLLWTSSLMF